MDLNFSLHPAQMEIFQSTARFKVAAAGRRFGKSYLAAVTLLIEGLKNENEKGYKLGTDKVVFYVAPTFQQGKDIMWKIIKELGKDVIKSTLENTGVVRLINDREIHIKGSDRPDTLRGVALSYVVLDEYATMKPFVWEEILRPTLADVEASALFIGTPAGKNHFYELFKQAEEDPEWEAFTFTSTSNPFLKNTEIEAARRNMAHSIFRQEFEASFQSSGGLLFTEDMVILGEEPVEGWWYVTVDPAGYADVASAGTSKLKRLDEMAIAVVKVSKEGWFVADILTGRWGIREASLRILMVCKEYKPAAVGIEKGALKNAIMPYLQDQAARLNVFPNIVECSHGGQKKTERIAWALQGRMQNKRVIFKKGEYLKKFKDQLMDFPNPMSHDDMLDALAYIDQISAVAYHNNVIEESWAPLDNIAGY